VQAFDHAHPVGALTRVVLSGAACHRVPPRWPNTPIQPTPLRVDKIGAILHAGFGYNGIMFYPAARLMGNSFGRFVLLSAPLIAPFTEVV